MARRTRPDRLDALAQRFLETFVTETQIQWTRGDIAQTLFRDYTPDDIERFAVLVGRSVDTLQRLAQVAGAFSPAVRDAYPALSWSHFRAAYRAARAHADDKIASDPTFWLGYAQEHGLNCDALAYAAHYYSPAVVPTAPVKARRAAAIAQYQAAERLLQRIEQQVRLFNQMHARAYGHRVVLTVEPLPAATDVQSAS